MTTTTSTRQRLLALFLALAFATVAMRAGPLPASAATGSILVVVADAAQPTPGETAVADHFTSTGLTTTLASDDDATPAMAETSDLVWISSNVSIAAINKDLPDISTPVIVSKPWLFDDYGLTDGASGNYGSATITNISITDPLDPTAGGLTGDIQPTPGTTRVSTGTPAASATIVATADGVPTIFHIHPGDPLADSTPAPACRLSFPAFQNHPSTHTVQAWTLLEATTDHALANCAAPDDNSDSVLMVVADADQPTPGEAAVADQLTTTGRNPTLASDEAVTPSVAATYGLVWISSNVSIAAINKDLPDISTPVIVSKPWLFDDYGLTASGAANYGSTTITDITISNPEDPTAGGLTGDINPTPGTTRVSTGTPTASATIVATANDTPTIFHVHPGDPLADSTPAPACRLSFPAFQNHPATYTPQAWTLFEATTTHGLTNCAASPAGEKIMFGMSPGGDREAELVSVENTLGRQLDLVRVFERWDAEPDAYHQQVAGPGRTMVLSVRGKRDDGSYVSWRDIADATPGSDEYDQMVTWATHVKTLDTDVLFSFNHEPEFAPNVANGDADDYIDAWRRFHEVFAAEGVDNVRWTWIMTAWSFQVPKSDRRSSGKWFPGDDVVDVLGTDAYNWANCDPGTGSNWRTLPDITNGFRQFADLHPAQDLLIAEWASTESPLGDKATWIQEAHTMFAHPAWDRLIGISYFNDNPHNPNCTFTIDSSAEALSAFQTVANDPGFGGGN